ncbi:hypothetical protein Van01_50760 [Micromonospora andamanensis]|uniref:DUF4440 domain-containing protein n=1 Tax=Micromonospora andamanensis TaxID=1287068 RepID=A0ABQ4I1X6_9ACTN|nr:hypothetical protein Van01_50760 [Micromonospora andamanensis]
MGCRFVAAPGQAVTGAARVAANQRFLDLGLPIDIRPRHVYLADDIALLIVDWTIDGQGADGQQVHLAGTATDVARRGPDGYWRYVIDNPFGTERLYARTLGRCRRQCAVSDASIQTGHCMAVAGGWSNETGQRKMYRA